MERRGSARPKVSRAADWRQRLNRSTPTFQYPLIKEDTLNHIRDILL